MEQQRQAIVFDFDGTLADSFPVALEIFYTLTHREPLPREDLTRLRGMTLRQVSKELRIPMYRIPFLLMRGRKAMLGRVTEIAMIPGMADVIRMLAKDFQLYIVSSNSRENIMSMLQQYNLTECFVDVEADIGLLKKTRRLRRFAKEHRLLPQETWYVGDEARDIEAAKHVGMPVVAVSWGYNNIHVLESHQPDALAFTPEELKDIVSA